jgi:hypothetical protein
MKNLSDGCQYPLRLYNEFARELPITYETFSRGLHFLHAKVNLSAIFLNFNVFKDAIDGFNYYRNASLNNVLSIHTTRTLS